MDRTKYLQLCQKYAVDKKQTIIFDNNKYYPVGYVMQFDEKGNPCNIAMLRDLNNKTIMYAKLERVEE